MRLRVVFFTYVAKIALQSSFTPKQIRALSLFYKREKVLQVSKEKRPASFAQCYDIPIPSLFRLFSMSHLLIVKVFILTLELAILSCDNFSCWLVSFNFGSTFLHFF